MAERRRISRLIALATDAGPNEMWWMSRGEARELRVIYEPWSYKLWHLEAYRGGAIATTESNDGLRSMSLVRDLLRRPPLLNLRILLWAPRHVSSEMDPQCWCHDRSPRLGRRLPKACRLRHEIFADIFHAATSIIDQYVQPSKPLERHIPGLLT